MVTLSTAQAAVVMMKQVGDKINEDKKKYDDVVKIQVCVYMYYCIYMYSIGNDIVC